MPNEKFTTFKTQICPRLYSIWLCQEVSKAQSAHDRAYKSNVMKAGRREKMAASDVRTDKALADLKALHEAQLAGKEVVIEVGS